MRTQQQREEYFAVLEAEKTKQKRYDEAIAQRVERNTRAAREARVLQVRSEYLKWRNGRISGNEIILIREKRKQRAARWDALTERKALTPAQRAKIEASRRPPSMSGQGFASGMRAFAKGAWSGNDDEKTRRQKRISMSGGAGVGNLAGLGLGGA